MEVQNWFNREFTTTEEADLSCYGWGEHGCWLELSEDYGTVEHFDGVDKVSFWALGDNHYAAMHNKKFTKVYNTNSLKDLMDWVVEAIITQ